jgi:hypothetical protein
MLVVTCVHARQIQAVKLADVAVNNIIVSVATGPLDTMTSCATCRAASLDHAAAGS